MKTANTQTQSSNLSASFANWRSAKKRATMGALALASLSTVRALQSHESAENARFMSAKANERRTDDNTVDSDEVGAFVYGETVTNRTIPASFASALLSPSERATLCAVRPQSVSLVFRKAAVAISEADEPLPSDFVPAPVAPYESALIADAAIEEQAMREAAEEIAAIEAEEAAARQREVAVSFGFDFSPQRDFSPVVPDVKSLADEARDESALVTVAARNEADYLLAAILAGAPKRRAVNHKL